MDGSGSGVTPIYVMGTLLFGTAAVVAAKSLLMTCSGPDQEIRFYKPAAVTLMYFCAMFMCVVPWCIGQLYSWTKWCLSQKLSSRSINDDGEDTSRILSRSLSDEDSREDIAAIKAYTFREFLRLLAPVTVEVIATLLSISGLMWVAASTFQMLRGSLCIFSALTSVVVFKRRYFMFHWFGLGLVVIAIGVIISASALDFHPEEGCAAVAQGGNRDGGGDDHEDTRRDQSQASRGVGLALILLGQCLHACQYALEESAELDLSIPPLLMTAMEGLWGGTLVVLLGSVMSATPGCDPRVSGQLLCDVSVIWHFDLDEAVIQFAGSRQLQVCMTTYMGCVLMSNVCGIRVTRLNAGHRTMLEAARTIFIWVFDLCLFYVVGDVYPWLDNTSAAEKWDSWAGLQLLGFFIMLGGTLVYNNVLKIPFLWYPSKWNVSELKQQGVLVPEAAIDPVFRRSDNRASDAIRKGFYMRIGVGVGMSDDASRGKRVRFKPGFTVIG